MNAVTHAGAASASHAQRTLGEGEQPCHDLAPRYSEGAMATAKQDARKVLDGLPEEASLEDIQYHLYVLQRIRRGREDVEAERVVPQDEVEQRLARWLEK